MLRGAVRWNRVLCFEANVWNVQYCGGCMSSKMSLVCVRVPTNGVYDLLRNGEDYELQCILTVFHALPV